MLFTAPGNVSTSFAAFFPRSMIEVGGMESAGTGEGAWMLWVTL